jgi:protein-S-isoprenylcysteine O-methyltransferase Ste14
MLLLGRLVQQGRFLFRWRSYAFLLLLIPAYFALPESGRLELEIGGTWENAWNLAALFIAYLGVMVRAATVGFVGAGTSGRNTREQRASALNTTGLYSIVRNPLYLANGLTIFGLALEIKSLWFIILAAAYVWLFYERVILAEENFLKQRFGAVYESWAARTPAIVPNVRLWHRPALGFSLRTVLRREFHGFFATTVALVTIEFGNDIVGQGMTPAHWVRVDYPWVMLLAGATIVYLALRLIRHRTDWLVVPGR